VAAKEEKTDFEQDAGRAEVSAQGRSCSSPTCWFTNRGPVLRGVSGSDGIG